MVSILVSVLTFDGVTSWSNFVCGASSTVFGFDCEEVSLSGVVPYFVLYADMRLWISLGKKVNPRLKHLLAG